MADFINVCESCKKKFKAKMSKTRFCTKKCRNKADREKDPEYYIKYRQDNKKKLQDYHKNYYIRNREKLIQDGKDFYQNNKEEILEKKYNELKEIYRECEERFNEGVITTSTATHMIFSYLNHNPESKDRMLLFEFPELRKKQASMIFHFWQKITIQKYNLELKKDKQELISNLYNHFKITNY